MVPGGSGAYWYNRANGAFRARVTFKGSHGQTLAFYNEVNGSALDLLTRVSDQPLTLPKN